MKLRSFSSVLVGVALVLLLAGGVGAVWLTAGNAAPELVAPGIAAPAIAARPRANPNSSAALTQPVSAASSLFLSRQAVAVLSLLSNPEQLSEFWLSALPGTLPAAQRQSREAELELLPQGIFAEFGLDYSRDLKSWLGDEATFAVMSADIDRDPETGLQPGYLLVLAVRDLQQAEASMQQFWQRQAGKDLVREQIAGIELLSGAASGAAGSARLASAAVGGQYMLLANDPKVLRTALNNAQVPELSLTRSFGYQQALEQVTEPQAGFLYANLAELSPELRQRWGKLCQLDLSHYDSLMLTLRPVAQGLRAEALLLADSPVVSQPVGETAGEPVSPTASDRSDSDASPLLRFMPTASRLAIVSRDLPQVWASATQIGQPNWQQRLLELQQRLGLPSAELAGLPDAVLRSDFGLAQLPHTGRADDWLLILPQSAQTAAAVAELDRLAQQQGMSLGSFQLGDQLADQPIYAWTTLKPSGESGAVSLQAEVQALHTEIHTGADNADNYALFATSLEALEQALSKQSSLAALNEAVQMPTSSQGYLYLDRSALEQRLQPNSLLTALLHSTRSALITRYGADETSQRAAAFLRLVD